MPQVQAARKYCVLRRIGGTPGHGKSAIACQPDTQSARGMPHDIRRVTEGDITVLLRRWREGNQSALEQLMPLVYPRLKVIADSVARGSVPVSDLQLTALVNEAFLRLVKQGSAAWDCREHFFSLAALVMRQILVDSARSRLASKRGGNLKRVPLHTEMQWVSINREEVIDLNAAL